MKNIFRDFFTFNKRERNGVFILLSIIGSLVLYLNISSNFVSQEKVNFAKFDKEVKEFESGIEEKREYSNYSEREAVREARLNGTEKLNGTEDKSEGFNFNPNNLSEENWKQLGLNDKQIKTIKKYESKGGKFRTKEDVKKMYCLSIEQYETLEPFIQIPSPAEIVRTPEKTKSIFQNGKVENANALALSKTVQLNIVELNSADSVTLTNIKGIGAFYAKNIIKHRNALGGFVSKEQLLEIWKFDQEKLNSIEKYIDIDESKIKKVNINTCEATNLKSPYIKWTVANAIVNYRKNHGKYKTVDEIKKTDLVDEETYRKIAPYLIVD